MEIPYTVAPRPDTGVYNAKLGIWLFLASEVMLFGGLFSAYLFLRLGAPDGYWPHGLLDVPVGTLNTAILIASSITVVLSWASLKMRQYARYRMFLGATILLGLIFLTIKLAYEYPAKFKHFGAFIKKDALAHYEPYLGNDYLRSKNLAPRYEITGHLHEAVLDTTKADQEVLHKTIEKRHLELKADPHTPTHSVIEGLSPFDLAAVLAVPGVTPVEYEVALDPVNADPTNPANDRPGFLYHTSTDKVVKIEAKDVDRASAFVPSHSTFFGVYFLITGLHGLHIVGGLVVMLYFFFFGHIVYRRNPEQMANRIEVCGLYWHFVDLVWIFVFPIFYLL